MCEDASMTERRPEHEGRGLPLQTEVRTFSLHRPEWLATGQQGKWAVVRGETVLGLYPDLKTAYTAGSSTYGPTPFLVREIRDRDDPAILQRAARRTSA